MTLRPSGRMQPSARTSPRCSRSLPRCSPCPSRSPRAPRPKHPSPSQVDNPPREGMAVGRANLDGTGVDRNLVSALGVAGDVAVNDSHVYWTRSESYPPSFVFVNNAIGRANLDGSHADPNFISGLPGFSSGIAVDASSLLEERRQHRARQPRRHRRRSELHQRHRSRLRRLAVDAGHIYWSHDYFIPDSAGIGRANLDGSASDQSFIPVRAREASRSTPSTLYWTRDLFRRRVAPNESRRSAAPISTAATSQSFMAAPTGIPALD